MSVLTLICLIGMLSVPAVLNIIAYPVSRAWSMAISNYIVRVCAVRLFSILNCYKRFHFFGYKKSKEQLPDQFIIVSNHQSLIDIPCYMNFFRDKELRFVAKDNLSRHIPVVSEMLRTQQHCMIPRKGSPMIAMKTVEKFGDRVIKNNWIPVIFPEGTRSRNGDVGKFYAAGFRKLCDSAKLPVAVCALDGGYQISDFNKIMTNLKNGCYRVKVLKVYDAPENKEEQAKILEEGRELIQAQLNEWRKLSTEQME